MDLKMISLRVPAEVLVRIDKDAETADLTRTGLLLRPWGDDPEKTAAPAAHEVLVRTSDLDAEVLEFARERAAARGVSVTEWLVQSVRVTRQRLMTGRVA